MKQISFSKWATIAMVAIATAIFCSCNPYKQIAKRSPVTHRDSVQLAYRCEATYPIDTSTKTVTRYIKGKDSSENLVSIIDSLKAAKNKILIQIQEKYRDTCKGAANDATDACNACYAQGYAQGKQHGYVRVDTVQNTNTITQVDHRLITLAEDRQRFAEGEEQKYKQKASAAQSRFIVTLCFLFLFLAGAFFLIKSLIKRR